MYQVTKRLTNNTVVKVELGVTNGKNAEHLANVHLYIEGITHIRGIMVYKKPDGYVIRQPGYQKNPTDKYKTSYMVLDKEIVDLIIEAVESTPKDKLVKFYEGPKTWSIWATPTQSEHAKGLDNSDKHSDYGDRDEDFY